MTAEVPWRRAALLMAALCAIASVALAFTDVSEFDNVIPAAEDIVGSLGDGPFSPSSNFTIIATGLSVTGTDPGGTTLTGSFSVTIVASDVTLDGFQLDNFQDIYVGDDETVVTGVVLHNFNSAEQTIGRLVVGAGSAVTLGTFYAQQIELGRGATATFDGAVRVVADASTDPCIIYDGTGAEPLTMTPLQPFLGGGPLVFESCAGLRILNVAGPGEFLVPNIVLAGTTEVVIDVATGTDTLVVTPGSVLDSELEAGTGYVVRDGIRNAAGEPTTASAGVVVPSGTDRQITIVGDMLDGLAEPARTLSTLITALNALKAANPVLLSTLELVNTDGANDMSLTGDTVDFRVDIRAASGPVTWSGVTATARLICHVALRIDSSSTIGLIDARATLDVDTSTLTASFTAYGNVTLVEVDCAGTASSLAGITSTNSTITGNVNALSFFGSSGGSVTGDITVSDGRATLTNTVVGGSVSSWGLTASCGGRSIPGGITSTTGSDVQLNDCVNVGPVLTTGSLVATSCAFADTIVSTSGNITLTDSSAVNTVDATLGYIALVRPNFGTAASVTANLWVTLVGTAAPALRDCATLGPINSETSYITSTHCDVGGTLSAHTAITIEGDLPAGDIASIAGWQW
jgi:hypothetical protein